MRYLLDVNALIALGIGAHAGHKSAERWLERVRKAGGTISTCPISELGFVRVSVQAGLLPDVSTARKVLQQIKNSIGMELLPDGLGADRLPSYVTKPAQLTDGHLLMIAAEHGAVLATLDAGIPGAEIIR